MQLIGTRAANLPKYLIMVARLFSNLTNLLSTSVDNCITALVTLTACAQVFILSILQVGL
jgi:hypothetical protein